MLFMAPTEQPSSAAVSAGWPAEYGGQGVPRGVHMRAAGQFGWLGLAPVHDHHVVAPGQQLQRDPPADEQGAAEDKDAHAASGRCRTRPARR